jgi:hypothetical protein
MKILLGKLIGKFLKAHTSATMGVAGAIVLAGGWLMEHPDIVQAVAPKWGGVVLAGAGFAVAIARMRTL